MTQASIKNQGHIFKKLFARTFPPTNLEFISYDKEQ